MQKQSRKPTNLSLDAALIAEARALKVNLSRAAEFGLRNAVSRAREAQWKRENAEALESSNRFVETRGLPLMAHKPF